VLPVRYQPRHGASALGVRAQPDRVAAQWTKVDHEAAASVCDLCCRGALTARHRNDIGRAPDDSPSAATLLACRCTNQQPVRAYWGVASGCSISDAADHDSARQAQRCFSPFDCFSVRRVL
jgi:hypothetical protein